MYCRRFCSLLLSQASTPDFVISCLSLCVLQRLPKANLPVGRCIQNVDTLQLRLLPNLDGQRDYEQDDTGQIFTYTLLLC